MSELIVPSDIIDVFEMMHDKSDSVLWEQAIQIAKAIRKVDAVPVVRCKYCKHRPIDTGGHNYGQDLSFPDDYKCPCRCGDQWYSWMPEDDWFCANGERKDDGEN